MSFLTLETVLDKDLQELSTLVQDVFPTSLGDIPYTSVDFSEYKTIKKQCIKMVPNGTGGMIPDIDDDRMMLQLIVAAVDKDERSDFTFRNAALLQKFGVIKDEQVVTKMLTVGEISRFAMAIQKASGFGTQAAKEQAEEVKNS